MQNNTFPTLFVGQNVVRLKEVDSTNNFLKAELSNSRPLPEGTVIMAEAQFAGRGQMNNTWHSEAGKNLTCSILLCPTFINPENQFLLNQSVSIAINDTLSEIIGEGLKIKWPNDIYYHNQKLGGLLIENILRGSTWNSAIVGIGLNVNQIDFPVNAKGAVSIKQILHRDYNVLGLLSDLCKNLEGRYLQLRAGKIDEIREGYHSRLLGFRQERLFSVDGEKISGSISGVNKSGQLEIETQGELRRYNFKEIAFIF